jgi:metal-responsive CopG/Arc/MetJ family transcriptional regulator
MKTKDSITLSTALISEVDRLIGKGTSRSAYIEKVLRDHLQDMDRQAIQLRDMERINAAADDLNAEAEDVLRYQVLGSQSPKKGEHSSWRLKQCHKT